MKVTAEINTDSPRGKRIAPELQKHHRMVKINYPTPTISDGDIEKTYSFEEFKANVKEEFKSRYGVNFAEV
ncbi:MAG: hypothetical protein PHT07_08290 [Paludibacter sp.]|nr:hypothetical protein [Paludibacter sp.]